jgi:hypothetical protein
MSGRQRYYRLGESVAITEVGRRARLTWTGPARMRIVVDFPWVD